MSGQKILQGAEEALAWARGETKAVVHIPGQEPRAMTVDEFIAEQKAGARPSDQLRNALNEVKAAQQKVAKLVAIQQRLGLED